MALVFKFQPFATWITWSKSPTFIGKGRCNTTSVNCENLIEESHKIFIRYKLYYYVPKQIYMLNLQFKPFSASKVRKNSFIDILKCHFIPAVLFTQEEHTGIHYKCHRSSPHFRASLSLGQQRKVCSFHIFLAFLSLYKVYIVLESALPQHVFKDNIVNQKSGERCIIRFLSFPLQIQIQKARMVVI